MGRLSRSSLYLYAAYTSTCLEDRAWSFGLSLCMSLLGGMQMVSIEQLAEGLVQMILSGSLGKFFDGCSRKTAILIAVPLNNFCIIIAAGFFFGCLTIDSNSWLFTFFLVMGMIFSAINRLFLNAEKFITGRDWVVVVAKTHLSDLNATLTALDQLANVISPLLVGGLVTLIDLKWTLIVFQAGSLLSMASKSFFLTALYKAEPSLHVKEKKKKENAETEVKEKSCCSKVSNALVSIPQVIVLYYKQTIFLAALGMALLFMTVMGFDGLAVGYGQSIGLPEAILGGFRSLGSAMGIAGALSYAFFEKRLGVRKAGLLGLTLQNVCLIVAVVSIWLPGSPWDPKEYFDGLTFNDWWSGLKNSFNGNSTSKAESHIDWKHFTADGNSMDSIFAFLIGIATARFGLWMADLCITHIMQVGVAEHQRNTVFGVHNALCQTFSVIKDLLVIALPDPRTFGLCIIISYGFVCTGNLCYIFYLLRHPETEAEKSKAILLKKVEAEFQIDEGEDDIDNEEYIKL